MDIINKTTAYACCVATIALGTACLIWLVVTAWVIAFKSPGLLIQSSPTTVDSSWPTESKGRAFDALLRTYNISQVCFNPTPAAFLVEFQPNNITTNPYNGWFMVTRVEFVMLANSTFAITNEQGAFGLQDRVHPDINGLECKHATDVLN